MTKEEYDEIQERLSKLLDKSQYLSSKKQEAYREGVLAAKSVLKSIQTYPKINAKRRTDKYCKQACSDCDLTLEECRNLIHG